MKACSASAVPDGIGAAKTPKRPPLSPRQDADPREGVPDPFLDDANAEDAGSRLARPRRQAAVEQLEDVGKDHLASGRDGDRGLRHLAGGGDGVDEAEQEGRFHVPGVCQDQLAAVRRRVDEHGEHPAPGLRALGDGRDERTVVRLVVVHDAVRAEEPV